MLRRFVRPTLSLGRRRFATLSPPLVDVSPFYDAAMADPSLEGLRTEAAAATSDAWRSHGLLGLSNYGGIAPPLVKAGFDSARALFALSEEQKRPLSYRDVRENVGWIESGLEKPDPTEPGPDPKEVFQVR